LEEEEGLFKANAVNEEEEGVIDIRQCGLKIVCDISSPSNFLLLLLHYDRLLSDLYRPCAISSLMSICIYIYIDT